MLFVPNIVLKISFPSSLVCSFRHGREEDEICGVSFNKELIVDRVQVSSCPSREIEKFAEMIINEIKRKKYACSYGRKTRLW